ncbi:MAG: carboxypeptidase M32 [Phycisphaerae bacterium]|nr:carboxypeptidase M32 [Phycisphaerae bacterium]MCZ2401120.1 carboxypeptidase M32 [Phycisphaerae bacterium]
MTTSHYAEFERATRQYHLLGSIESLLDWDQETCMPPRGVEQRAEQLALVAGLAHERLTGDEFATALGKAERNGRVDEWASATNLREMRRRMERARRLPTELVRETAKVSSLAKQAWARARRESRFELFAPPLERLLELKRRAAELIGFEGEPYDALLDEYEPGARSAEVAAVFDELKKALVPLAAAIAKAPRKPDVALLSRYCPKESQAEFCRRVAAALGFDFQSGRMDVSMHPFCSGTCPHDVRITTRYDERFLPAALFGTMHEVGHALYEQGLDAAHAGTPAGQSVSLGIHESQSRMWENFVGRSRPFWEHWFGPLTQQFTSLAEVRLDDWVLAINNVRPSLIRVEADEVTYGLHIMLRFDLERRLMTGKLAVRDIPQAWNDGMRSLLGITPDSDANGCLQDIHWSMGAVGYFPTYALGNLYAAQFFEAARAAMPDLDDHFRRGSYAPLLEWLRRNIHRHGMRHRAAELVQAVTGRPLSAEPFVRYLRAKFEPLYGINA